MAHEFDDPSKFVRHWVLASKLFASANVISEADEVMRRILEIYNHQNMDFRKPIDRQDRESVDVLRAFSEACRHDLHA